MGAFGPGMCALFDLTNRFSLNLTFSLFDFFLFTASFVIFSFALYMPYKNLVSFFPYPRQNQKRSLVRAQ